MGKRYRIVHSLPDGAPLISGGKFNLAPETILLLGRLRLGSSSLFTDPALGPRYLARRRVLVRSLYAWGFLSSGPQGPELTPMAIDALCTASTFTLQNAKRLTDP